MSDELTEQQAQNILRQFAQSKNNLHSFLTKVVKSEDTTKTGNLEIEELGMPKVPVRTLQELELFSRDVYKDESWANFFKKMAEIQLATSLSKEAVLLKLAVTNKQELSETSSKRKKNKGWFKKK